MKYRSKFEAQFAKSVPVPILQYEKHKLPYQVPAQEHIYTPDFKITGTNIFLELKGRFVVQDRKKQLLVQKQYPQYRIIIVFMQPNQTISKASRTTYSQWCDKNNIEWMTASDALSLIKSLLAKTNSSA